MSRISCALLLVLSACEPNLESASQLPEPSSIEETSSTIADTGGSSVGLPLGENVYRFTRYGVDIKIQTYKLCPGRTVAYGSVVSSQSAVCIQPYAPPTCTSLCCKWIDSSNPPEYLYKEDTSSGIQFVLYTQAMSTNNCDAPFPADE